VHERQRIFDRFYRASGGGRRGEGGGAGLGLALVQETVRLHGGRIQVTEAAIGGARFVVDLPVLDAQDESGAAGQASPMRARNSSA
jgi:two-component system OmpR family sensor kinase